MINRRDFLFSSGAILGGLRAGPENRSAPKAKPGSAPRLPDPESFDPWVEIVADAIRNNVREIRRFSGLRLLAVIKNNANGIGLSQIGPILDAMDDVHSLAVARVGEALDLRAAGVKKPILIMAHASDKEAGELARQDVRLTLFHDDALRQVERLASSLNRPVAVHLKIDTGMNRIGMRFERALPWIEGLAASKAVRIEGFYTMFSGGKTEEGRRADLVHLSRFLDIVKKAKEKGINPGLLHGAPSIQVVNVPETHKLDLTRPGGAIYGLDAYRTNAAGEPIMNILPVFRLRARVVRVEKLREGDGVSFDHRFVAKKPTWIATLPVGHTDGYPRDAPGKASVLIGDAVYPVIAVISSNHTIVEIGDEKRVEVGDIATLVGPDHPDITPIAVATRCGLGRDYWIMTKLNALLRRRVV